MRLERLYRATFTTPEAWHVELSGEYGVEEQGFLVIDGRTDGRVTGRLRASNFPRRRADGTQTPDIRGVIETDDGSVVLFSWHGYGRAGSTGARQLVGSLTHVSDDERYTWLNDAVCAVEGEVRPQDGGGFSVVLDVFELVWEALTSVN
ncbi:MAG: hypothetical protein ACRD12_13535 [Acidimicrobiales bacterium]